MKEINGYLLVEVPEGSVENKIAYNEERVFISFPDVSCSYQLPKGNYSIIGLGKDLSDEHICAIQSHQTKSFDQLLKANNLNPNNCLILKKID